MLCTLRLMVCTLCALQVFAQPVFENVETLMTKNQVWPSKQPRLMRAVVRSLYVVMTTFVAICIPFFADLMGLIGAAGFTPMTFILPCVFWLKVRLAQHICGHNHTCLQFWHDRQLIANVVKQAWQQETHVAAQAQPRMRC